MNKFIKPNIYDVHFVYWQGEFIQSQAAMMRMLKERLQGVLCVHDVCMTALY